MENGRIFKQEMFVRLNMTLMELLIKVQLELASAPTGQSVDCLIVCECVCVCVYVCETEIQNQAKYHQYSQTTVFTAVGGGKPGFCAVPASSSPRSRTLL